VGEWKMIEDGNSIKPFGDVKIVIECYWTLPFMVDLPINNGYNGDFPVRYVNVYQRVATKFWGSNIFQWFLSGSHLLEILPCWIEVLQIHVVFQARMMRWHIYIYHGQQTGYPSETWGYHPRFSLGLNNKSGKKPPWLGWPATGVKIHAAGTWDGDFWEHPPLGTSTSWEIVTTMVI
jgi:hypothetical protein